MTARRTDLPQTVFDFCDDLPHILRCLRNSNVALGHYERALLCRSTLPASTPVYFP